MATKKKMLQAAAGSATGGGGLDIDEVFSTYLYEGTGSAQTITNGIDLSGEGGLIWTKSRSHGHGHRLVDTVNGVGKYLRSESTAALRTDSYAQEGVTAFNSNGYSLGNWANEDGFHRSGREYASWTFRKAPKFFDVVTYTGTGSHPRNVSHNLGSAPGMILVKNLGDGTEDWIGYHRGVDSSAPEDYGIFLNLTDSRVNNDAYWGDTAPTSTTFTVGGNITNRSGQTYVAYLFAHNDGDGEFGPDGDADVIKCGSYTGDGTTDGSNKIDVGFEPQWLMIKRTNTSSGWLIMDSIRGMTSGGADPTLSANSGNAEATTWKNVTLHPDGFSAIAGEGANGSGSDYIYMAIRRGPLAVPEDATEVFDVDAYSGNSTAGRIIPSAFPVDLAIVQSRSAAGDTNAVADRLRGANVLLNTPNTHAELTNNTDSITGFDFMDGIEIGTDTRTNWSSGTYVSWMWKRAPGYFDAVAYTGNGTSGRTVSHNLGVVPEMMWVKNRSSTYDWICYHKGSNSSPEDYYLSINDTDEARAGSFWNGTLPTDASFSLSDQPYVNASSSNYIAYLFASAPGVSKVGSYTGTGNTLNVDCGFTSGARFVFIKTADDSGGGSWYTVDSARGIVAGDDPTLKLEDTAAEFDNKDWIDPLSSGFTITSTAGTSFNASGVTYIFYAIA